MIYAFLVFFIATTLFAFVALCLSVYFALRLGRKVLVLEEKVEESLDRLDSCYHKLFALSNTPVMYDEPVVRQVLAEIRRAKDAVLIVANNLVAFSDSKDDDDDAEHDDDDNN